MIKINLATRKQASLADNKSSLGSLNLDQLKDLPLRKAIAPILIGVVANYGLGSYQDEEIRKLDETVNKLNATEVKLKQNLEQFDSYSSVKKQLDQDEAAIKNKLETIRKLSRDRDQAKKMVIALANAVPEYLWLEDLTYDGTDLSIKGGASEYNLVSDFMKNMNENAFFSQVELKSTETRTDSGTGLERAVFELVAKKR